MPNGLHRGLAAVRLTVTVYVDATNPELIALRHAGGSAPPLAEVVRSEIISNLESVSYVRHVIATGHQSKGGST